MPPKRFDLGKMNNGNGEFEGDLRCCGESCVEILVSGKQVCNYYTHYKYMLLKVPC